MSKYNLTSDKLKWGVSLGITVAILCILPQLLGQYYIELIIEAYVHIILAVSFYIILLTGEWSFAHVVMMGVGAYSSSLMATKLGIPVLVAIPLAGLVAAGIAAVLSFPLVRMTGFGFFIGSYAAGEAIRLSWVRIRDPFGGTRGLVGIPTPEPILIPALGTIDLGNAIPYYFFTLGVMAACLFVMYRVDQSRLGDNFRAIRSNPDLAASVGINVSLYRTIAFVIGSFFAGIAGTLLAHRLRAINPADFTVTSMLYCLVWVVAGGATSFAGPILGVSVMTPVFEATRPLAAWRPLVYGAILIAMLLFIPGGLAGLIARARSLFQRPK